MKPLTARDAQRRAQVRTIRTLKKLTCHFSIHVFEEFGWDWSYHAFREYAGWSVEHEGEDSKSLRPSADTPRMRALLRGFNLGRARR